MSIYTLHSNHNYQSLFPAEDYGLLAVDIYQDSTTGPWQTFKVCYAVGPDAEGEDRKPKGDFPHSWLIGMPVMSQRAYEKIGPIIAPYVDILPLSSETEDFYAFRVHNVIAALDVEISDIEWLHQLRSHSADKPRYARKIKRFAFQDKSIDQQVIFRLPQFVSARDIFVTDHFTNLIKEHGLTGLELKLIYPPIPKAEQYQKYLKKRKRS